MGPGNHAGSTVTYTQQNAGSGAATIAISQPDMLFWASPVGDAFQGASGLLNGAQISDFTAASSLDFTDLLEANAVVTYTQGNGAGTLMVTDGSHSASLTLIGSFTPNLFHLSTDGHGGALVTY